MTDRGIDNILDGLRATSSDLISQMQSNMEAASKMRISESKARYQEWNVRKIESIVQPQIWSNAIILDKDEMDPKKWRSEMSDASAKTEQLIDTAVSSHAAGVKPGVKTRAPAFFAWTLSPEEQLAKAEAQVAQANAETEAADAENAVESAAPDSEWVREGNGWKSADGIFLSDDDLIADVLGKAKDGVIGEQTINEMEENAGESDPDSVDSDENPINSEHRLEFRWRPTEQTALRVPKYASDILNTDKGESVSHWATEYDSSSAAALAATATVSPVAGVPTSACLPAPLMFSWKRDKGAKAAAAAEGQAFAGPVFIGAPFDRDLNPSCAEWASEYDWNFTEKPPNNLLHTEASLSTGAPFGTYQVKLDQWCSEYDSVFRPGGKIPTMVNVDPYATDSSSDEERGAVDQTFTDEGFDQAGLEKKLTPKRFKSSKPLRFTSEHNARFVWPVPGSPAKQDSCKPEGMTKIHHTEPFQRSPAPTVAPEVREANKALLVSQNQTMFRGALPTDAEKPLKAWEPKSNKGNRSERDLLAHNIVNVNERLDEEKEEEEDNILESAAEERAYDSLEVGSYERDAGDTISSTEKATSAEEGGKSVGEVDEYDEDWEPEAAAVEAIAPVAASTGASAAVAAASKGEIKPVASVEKKRLVVRGKVIRMRKPVGAGELLALQQAVRATKASKSSSSLNKKVATKGPNPLLKNRRYPGGSDKQNGRFRSEASSQFVWRPKPLNL